MPKLAPFSFRISKQGIMAANIPAKRIATSIIGWNVNSFFFLVSCRVEIQERSAIVSIAISLKGAFRKIAALKTPISQMKLIAKILHHSWKIMMTSKRIACIAVVILLLFYSVLVLLCSVLFLFLVVLLLLIFVYLSYSR